MRTVWGFNRRRDRARRECACRGLHRSPGALPRHRMVHSGVFVERQYCQFAGIAHGQKTYDFIARLVRDGFARETAQALQSRALFHVHHKRLYTLIRPRLAEVHGGEARRIGAGVPNVAHDHGTEEVRGAAVALNDRYCAHASSSWINRMSLDACQPCPRPVPCRRLTDNPVHHQRRFTVTSAPSGACTVRPPRCKRGVQKILP